jgi:hypothetical protein
MKTAKLKTTRTAERRKVDLAIKYRDEGKATGGGRTGVKKIRRGMEARNLPLQKHTPKPSGKQKTGRRRST